MPLIAHKVDVGGSRTPQRGGDLPENARMPRSACPADIEQVRHSAGYGLFGIDGVRNWG
jgi:hypothetical protein